MIGACQDDMRRCFRAACLAKHLAAGIVAVLLYSGAAHADSFDYRLQPRQIADRTWVLIGATEDFSRQNGGNIVNTAFVDTSDGVIVIDSGPTRRYGEAMRRAIATVTAAPIREVWLTHHHPDHFLGNQAFADVPIAALSSTANGIRREGGAFTDNVYRMTGDWAKDTEVQAPTATLTEDTRTITIGGHRFRLLALAGHTGSDLAILDETTGVLFAGDLVFHDRAPTTPHANIGGWLASLEVLEALPFRQLVPGHGEPTRDGGPIAQTRRWLQWLDSTLREAAAEGLDAGELLDAPMPADLARLPLARHEFVRSLAHLYRSLETGVVGRDD